MSAENSKRDENRTTVMLAVTNDANLHPTMLRIDPNTYRLLVTGTISSLPNATTPAIFNVTMTIANTEYSQALPAGTKQFSIQCKGAFDMRFAYVTGKVAGSTAPFGTIKSGMNYFELNVSTSATVYVACSEAAQVAEIIAWS